jgi:threonine dehydratase
MFPKIKDAARRLEGLAHVTPVMTSRTLDQIIGARVYFKCENLQRIGAFKFRGAYNAISKLSDAERARGVITFSSGNHAQAVALVGQLLSVRTVVVMPTDAPAIKRQATAGYGAEVIDYDPATCDRQVLAEDLCRKYGYTLIPPYDHTDIIAGQATAAYELLHAVGDLNLLLVPCGGGGLLSGSAIAAKGLSSQCRVVGVEPELADDATRSFQTRTLQRIAHSKTIADGTRTPSLGRLTFPLILEYVDDMCTVSEAAIMEAVRFFFYRMKIVVEPSGALGLAALLSQAVKSQGRVGVMISGGNIDGSTLARILTE